MEEEIREDGTPEGASHYQKTSIQPIEMFQQIFPKEMVYGFCVCNAFKYLYRLKQKGQEAKDIEKAATYARWAADLLEGKTINPRKKE